MTIQSNNFRIHRPRIPWVPHYWVLSGPPAASLSSLLVSAEQLARTQALVLFGDPECFSLIVNAGRTRRVAWPHVHILVAPSAAKKRRAMFWLALKHITRPARWFRSGRTSPEHGFASPERTPRRTPREAADREPLSLVG